MLVPAGTVPAQKSPSEAEIAHAIALLSEGLISNEEFHALTGMDSQRVAQHMADPLMLTAVQRTILKLRNSGAIARLEALRHARGAVEVAADIMGDTEMHPSTRLNAAAFLSKVAGTERPAPELSQPSERHTITINISGRPPLIISSDPARMPSPAEPASPAQTFEEGDDAA
jgi:hypothetical protein